MRLGPRLMRRCIAFALPCWLVAAPVAAFVQNAAACRHQAMHQGVHHGATSHAPCWCGDMTGNTSLLASDAPALPTDSAAVVVWAGTHTLNTTLPSDGLPTSPSYAPTPPPPNGFPA